MGSLYLSTPWWYIGGCLLLGVIAALLLYYKDKNYLDKPVSWRSALAVLRGVSVAILAFLLLSPFFRRVESEIKKPILVFLHDQSESIPLATGEKLLQTAEDAADDASRKLADDYEVVRLAIGSEARLFEGNQYQDKATDFEAGLQYIHDGFDPRRLAGAVLWSDGLYNQGANPLYSPLASLLPLYSVALGNATSVRDLAIKRVFHNKVTYKGDRFNLLIDLAGRNAKGEQSELILQDITTGTPKTLHQSLVSLSEDHFFETKELMIDAGEPGLRRFRVRWNALDDERNKLNNEQEFFVKVLDARQKILILADAPHPDIGTVRQALEKGKNYQIDVKMASDPTVKTVKGYDLIIVHQLPSNRNPAIAFFQEINEKKIPVWFIAGMQTDFKRLSSLQGLLDIRTDGRQFNDAGAIVNPRFQVFKLSEESQRRIGQFPPLTVPFGEFTPVGNGQSIFQQRIGSVPTEYPMWLLGEDKQVRKGILTGEGIWRWRLFDYLQHANHDIIDESIRKTVQYLALKEDKRRFRVTPSKALYKETDQVILDGELYNENFELINTPDVQVSLFDENDREYTYVMNKSTSAYTLMIGRLNPGNYRYSARTTLNQQEMRYDGKLTVQKVDLEQADLQADHNLLNLLATQTGAIMVTPDNVEELIDHIRNHQSKKPILYSQIETRPLIDWGWLFGILILLLGAEWFIRRYLGGY